MTQPSLNDIRAVDDCFEYALRVELLSDSPQKIQRFVERLAEAILDFPDDGDDVAISVHAARDEIPRSAVCKHGNGPTCPQCEAANKERAQNGE